jgi:ThiF family
MSQLQISRSPDLSRLRAEGYNISVEGGHLVMRDVPCVTPSKQIGRCIIADAYNDATGQPANHTMWMSGEKPCDENGQPLTRYLAGDGALHDQPISENVVAQWYLSIKLIDASKNHIGDTDYYSKFTRYADKLGAAVKALGGTESARTFPVVLPDVEEKLVFKYHDTASVRAHIVPVSKNLVGQRIAIVGVGGTGSYILDLVAKTPVAEIHLYDPDTFLQHNAFRAPGAASAEGLARKMAKVDYFAEVYGNMRSSIVPHAAGLTAQNVHELGSMHFVFLAVDPGEHKKLAVAAMLQAGVPFVDCGMGIYVVNDSLAGQLRLTTVTASKQDHVDRHIKPNQAGVPNEYAHNIQVAELNALNASLAVVRWKKHFGFYNDLEREHNCTYAVDGNAVLNEECQ